ncbi:MAG TPA: DUF2017 domain-containing protein [Gordonia sp. (in: high G+C Gram-positive bacteria)]|uniref:oxidative stress transcriptional regulator AosR n=1 Tax=unclassified Gordonia (in: high G+C Gram-positive bacteria) TaxID=2657482 RepID=UPI000F989BA3|nr:MULTISPECIES: DUF2017 domain-containing protein [unclassified Gordonia (in: high G+C Gram-positive bacteria)]RUP40882.1 MAG: DUF2017 domain-containing protein [Gordonia sp. (in: high G+C Gram-positive bacteria)]HNP57704.1 DUF2017 domain-containing protein [Gordonia sp. (in: high G+C Gram-positive bacteria)]HRC51317.1 DUF2017 domain-containing protein [Gordonia sp. (in: high G+C Gram-positive bacteria)]
MTRRHLTGWKRRGSGSQVTLSARCSEHESELLHSIVSSMRELLVERSGSAPVDELAAITGIRSGHSTAPRDATLGRLLPDFHRPDQDEELGCDTVSGDLNGALRSINEPLIIDDKLAAAQCLLDTVPVGGGEITLTAAQAEQWLTAINDVRLSLGAMLGIDEDTPEELDPDHPYAAHLHVYRWLTEQQWILVEELMR